jgi:NAD(P)-dependent dehydrogenase (short-subunit alcohol dehydrogenase family)
MQRVTTGAIAMGERVKGKVAIVTGAGSVGPGWGNGKAATVLYAREGASVFAVDVNPAAVEETRAIIAGEGGDCTTRVADVTDGTAVAGLVDACLARYGRIDILHNNVGIVEVGGPVEIAEAAWDRLLAVNLKSMYLNCKHVLPIMERQGGGAIVNVSSFASIRYVGYPCVSYAASKGAVNQLTQNIAVQYAAKGIRANCILPGLMNTPMIVKPLKDAYGEGGYEEMIRKRDAQCPMGRMGTAWDVAYAALFLASDEAGYVSGVNLLVDGALSAKVS